MQMTQEALAQQAGLSTKTINRFENGRHDGRFDTVKRLAKALKVDTEAITGPPPPPLGLGANGAQPNEVLIGKVDEILSRMDTLEAQLALLVPAVQATGKRSPAKARKSRATSSRPAKKRATG